MMDRRQFLKIASLFAAQGAVAGGVARAAPAGEEGPLVSKVKDPSAGAATRKAVAALGGMGAFVSRGQTVVVKPNIGWDRSPEQAANTNPEVVREVVLMCLEAGAARIKVFDRTCNDPRRCYVTSRIGPTLEEMKDPRVEVTHIDDRRFRVVDSPGAFVMKSASYYTDALEADRFINVPVAKHHSASGLTLGMKNIMGVLGANRATLHRNLHEALVDMNRVVRSHLTIIDATRILVANGPQGGRLEDVRAVDTVIASSDVVAADAVAAALFGKSAKDLRFLQLAEEAGLGVARIDGIRLRASGT